MKNEYIVYIVAAIIGISLGSGGFYYNKNQKESETNKQILVSQQEMVTVGDLYMKSELCFRSGYAMKTPENGLEDIVYKLSTEAENGQVQRIIREKFEKRINELLPAGINTNENPLEYAAKETVFTAFCESVVHKATNIKSKYSVKKDK